MGVKDFRKNMKTVLDGGKPVVIGSEYELRAFVVPLPKHNKWDDTECKKALAAAKKLFLELFKAEAE